MDLRFLAVLMAVAVVMDMLGRMAKKRAAQQQDPSGGEDWDMSNALAEAEELRQPVARATPQVRREQREHREQIVGGFELWSETPSGPGPTKPGALDAVRRKPMIESAGQEPVTQREPVIQHQPIIRDRAPEPLVVRSLDPRPVEQRPESAPAGPSDEFATPVPRLPAPRMPAPQIPVPQTRPRRRFRAARADDRLGLGTPGGLRTAVVAREVLGPPLALRSDDGGFEGR